jgi:hypothetical protein
VTWHPWTWKQGAGRESVRRYSEKAAIRKTHFALLGPGVFIRGFFRIFFVVLDIVYGSSEVLAGFFIRVRRLRVDVIRL